MSSFHSYCSHSNAKGTKFTGSGNTEENEIKERLRVFETERSGEEKNITHSGERKARRKTK